MIKKTIIIFVIECFIFSQTSFAAILPEFNQSLTLTPSQDFDSGSFSFGYDFSFVPDFTNQSYSNDPIEVKPVEVDPVVVEPPVLPDPLLDTTQQTQPEIPDTSQTTQPVSTETPPVSAGIVSPQDSAVGLESQSDDTLDLTDEEIAAELESFVSGYLGFTGRNLSILEDVTANFTSLIVEDELYTLDELTAILNDKETLQAIEGPLAEYLDEEELDLTDKEQVKELVSWGEVIGKWSAWFEEQGYKVVPADDWQNYIKESTAEKTDKLLEIALKGIQELSFKDIVNIEEKDLIDYKDFVELVKGNNYNEEGVYVNIDKEVNLVSKVNSGEIAVGDNIDYMLRVVVKPDAKDFGKVKNINFDFSLEGFHEEWTPNLVVKLISGEGDGKRVVEVVLDDVKQGENSISIDMDEIRENLPEGFDLSNIRDIELGIRIAAITDNMPLSIPEGTSIAFENIKLNFGDEGQDAILDTEKKKNVFLEMFSINSWTIPEVQYINKLLSTDETRQILENWSVVAPEAKQLIWRDLSLDYWNIKDEGILGGIILRTQERTGKDVVTKADVLDTFEELRSEYSEIPEDDVSRDTESYNQMVSVFSEKTRDEFISYTESLTDEKKKLAIRVLLEDGLQRELDLKSYKDVLAFEYWNEIADVKGIEFIADTFSERKSLMGTVQQRGLLIEEIAKRVGGNMKYQLVDFRSHDGRSSNDEDVSNWDWPWYELAHGGAPDEILEMVAGGAFMKDFLEDTIWPSTGSRDVIDINDPLEINYWFYYTKYLPLSGASQEQIVKFILSKEKFLPYDAISVGTPEAGANAIKSAGKTSYNVFSENKPFTAEQQKRMLVLSPAVKSILGELLGNPNPTVPVGENSSDFFNRAIDEIINYFVELRDISTGIMADALGGTDNSMGTTGFLAMAALIGAEKGQISKDKANHIVQAIVDFIHDDPNDPSDLNAQGQFGLLYHYYRPQTDERAGNAEVSLIDTYLTVAALIAYRNWDGVDSEVVNKINTFINSIELDAIRQEVDNEGFKGLADSHLNFGWTDERGLTAGDVDFYNEYILCYLIAIGSAQENNSELVSDLVKDFNEIIRKKDSGASGVDFIYTFENSMFQYQYPQLFIPLMFLSRTENLDGGGEIPLNNFQNAIKALYNQQATAVAQSENYHSYNWHSWAISPSAALPSYYTMIMSIPPAGTDGEGDPYYEGTVSANAIAGSMQFAPMISYDGLRYMSLAYPQMQGEYGFKDSINPDRNWVSPTYFSLGQGLSLMGMWNALYFGNDSNVTPLELNLRDKHVLASLFNLGFGEDVSPQFREVLDKLNNNKLSFEEDENEVLDAMITKVDYDELIGYLEKNGIDTERAKTKWETEIGSKASGLNKQEIKDLINGKTEDGKLTNEDIDKIFDKTNQMLGEGKALAIADYNLIAEVLKGDKKANEGLMKWEEYEAGKGKDYRLNSEESINYLLFPLFMQVRIEQTKQTMKNIFETPDVGEKEGLEKAEAYIDKVEQIRQAAFTPDESAMFAFQHYNEVADKYYTKAEEALGSVISGGIDTEKEVKAQALLFTVYKKTWQYDKQKQAFIKLAEAVKDNEDFKNIASEIITKYFGHEILANYENEWVAPYKNLNDDQYDKQREAVKSAIEKAFNFSDPDPENPPEDYSLTKVLQNNQISLIPTREIYLRQNVAVNPLDPQEAGEIGFYVTKLYGIEAVTEREIIENLKNMVRLKPLVEVALDRELDLQNNENDVALLSLAVSQYEDFKENNPDTEISNAALIEIAKVVSGEDVDRETINEAIEDFRSFKLSSESKSKVDEAYFLLDYLSGSGRGELEGEVRDILTSIYEEQGLSLDDKSMDEWVQLYADIFTEDNINESLIKRVVGELYKIAPLNTEGKTAFHSGSKELLGSKGEVFVYKDEYFGGNSNLDMQDDSVLEIVHKAKEIQNYLKDVFGKDSINIENSELDRFLVSRLTKLVLDEDIEAESLDLGEIKALLDNRSELNTDNKKKMLMASVIPYFISDNLKDSGVILDTFGDYISEVDLNSVPFDNMGEFYAWVEENDKEKISEKLNTHITELAEKLPAFLEEYVIGEKYDKSKHGEFFREWFGYRISEVEESMHRLYDIEANGDLIYRLGISVDVPHFRLTTPVTQNVVDMQNIDPLARWLYGDLLDTLTPEELEELTLDNVVYRALLGFYADEPESTVVTSLLLAIEKELLEGNSIPTGLETLYGVQKFDILNNTDHIGIAGYHLGGIMMDAGIGVVDDFLARLFMKRESLEGIGSAVDELGSALAEVFRDGDVEILKKKFIELVNNEGEDKPYDYTESEALREANKWFEYIQEISDECLCVQPDLGDSELMDVVIDRISSSMKDRLSLAEDFIDYVENGDRAGLTNKLSEVFGVSSNDIAEHIADMWIESVEFGLNLDSYIDIVQAAGLRFSKDSKLIEINRMIELKPLIEEYKGRGLDLFGGFDDIGLLSFYADEVALGKRSLAQEKRFLKYLTYLKNSLGDLFSADNNQDDFKNFRIIEGIDENWDSMTAEEKDKYKELYLESQLSFWAEEIAEDVEKLVEEGMELSMAEEEVESDLNTFFANLEIVKNIISSNYSHELEVSKAGKKGLLLDILEEKGIEGDVKITADVIDEFYEQKTEDGKRTFLESLGLSDIEVSNVLLYASDSYLDSIYSNSTISYWAEYMLANNLDSDGLNHFFKQRKKVLPLLGAYLGRKVDLSDSLISGLVSSLAQKGITNIELDITKFVNKDFVLSYLDKYLGKPEHSELIDLLREGSKDTEGIQVQGIAGLKALEDFLGTEPDIKYNPIHGGFVNNLVEVAWGLVQESLEGRRELSEVSIEELANDAVEAIGRRLENIMEFIPDEYRKSDGTMDPSKIEELISDSDKMGSYGYFADLIEKVSIEEETTDAEQMDSLYSDFFSKIYGDSAQFIRENLGGLFDDFTTEDWAKLMEFSERYTQVEFPLPEDYGEEDLQKLMSAVWTWELFDTNTENYNFASDENKTQIVLAERLWQMHRLASLAAMFSDGSDVESGWKEMIIEVANGNDRIKSFVAGLLGISEEEIDPKDVDISGFISSLTEAAINRAQDMVWGWVRDSKEYRDKLEGFLGVIKQGREAFDKLDINFTDAGIDVDDLIEDIQARETIGKEVEVKDVVRGIFAVPRRIRVLFESQPEIRKLFSKEGLENGSVEGVFREWIKGNSSEYNSKFAEFLRSKGVVACEVNGQLKWEPGKEIVGYEIIDPHTITIDIPGMSPEEAGVTWAEWMAENGGDIWNPTEEELAYLQELVNGTTVTREVSGGRVSVWDDAVKWRDIQDYREEFEEEYSELVDGLFNQSPLDVALDEQYKRTEQELCVGAILKPYVQDRTWINIDPTNRLEMGVLSYFVGGTFVDAYRSPEKFEEVLDTLVQEGGWRKVLADRYNRVLKDSFEGRFVGFMAYASERDLFNPAEWSRKDRREKVERGEKPNIVEILSSPEKLEEYGFEVGLSEVLYGEKGRLNSTDDSLLIKGILKTFWPGWDWTGQGGWYVDQNILAQMKYDLRIASMIDKDRLVNYLGLESKSELDFVNNPEHLIVLMRWVDRTRGYVTEEVRRTRRELPGFSEIPHDEEIRDDEARRAYRDIQYMDWVLPAESVGGIKYNAGLTEGLIEKLDEVIQESVDKINTQVGVIGQLRDSVVSITRELNLVDSQDETILRNFGLILLDRLREESGEGDIGYEDVTQEDIDEMKVTIASQQKYEMPGSDIEVKSWIDIGRGYEEEVDDSEQQTSGPVKLYNPVIYSVSHSADSDTLDVQFNSVEMVTEIDYRSGSGVRKIGVGKYSWQILDNAGNAVKNGIIEVPGALNAGVIEEEINVAGLGVGNYTFKIKAIADADSLGLNEDTLLDGSTGLADSDYSRKGFQIETIVEQNPSGVKPQQPEHIPADVVSPGRVEQVERELLIPDTIDIKELLEKGWGLSGDKLDATLEYFNTKARDVIERELRDHFSFRTHSEPFIEKALARAVANIARLTKGKFSFWMERDDSVSYPRYITMYPETDGKCDTFVKRYIGHFARELEGAVSDVISGEIRKGSRDYRNLEDDFMMMLDGVSEETLDHNFWTYNDMGAKVGYKEAVEDIISSLPEPESVVPVNPASDTTVASSSGSVTPASDSAELADILRQYNPELQEAEPFEFAGTISSDSLSVEEGDESIFTVRGNVEELDSAYIVITDASGNEIDRIGIRSWKDRYSYTWKEAGEYRVRITGNREGEEYSTEAVNITVREPEPQPQPRPEPEIQPQPQPQTQPQPQPQPEPEVTVLDRVDFRTQDYTENGSRMVWNRVDKATGYRWQLLDNDQSVIKEGKIYSADTTEQEIDYRGLEEGFYTFRVKAIREKESQVTAESTGWESNLFWVNKPEPAAPEPVNPPDSISTVVDRQDVIINWQDNADKYKVDIYMDGRKLWGLSRNRLYNNSLSLKDLDAGEYEVRVYSINEEDIVSEGYVSDGFSIEEVSVEVVAPEPHYFTARSAVSRTEETSIRTPSVETVDVSYLDNVEFIDGNNPIYFDTGLSIYWDSVNNADRYLYQIVNNNGRVVNEGRVYNTRKSIYFNELSSGLYSFRIKAVNTFGLASQNWSDSIEFNIPREPEPVQYAGTSRAAITSSYGSESPAGVVADERRETTVDTASSLPLSRSYSLYSPIFRSTSDATVSSSYSGGDTTGLTVSSYQNDFFNWLDFDPFNWGFSWFIW